MSITLRSVLFPSSAVRTVQMTWQLMTLHSWREWQKGWRLSHMLFLFLSVQIPQSSWFTPFLSTWEKYTSTSYVDNDFWCFCRYSHKYLILYSYIITTLYYILKKSLSIFRGLVCMCTVCICKHGGLCMPQLLSQGNLRTRGQRNQNWNCAISSNWNWLTKMVF